MQKNLISALKELEMNLQGDLFFDDLMRKIYATDASVYRILPLAVALPKSNADLKQIIAFATKHNVGVIPRTAGTSLAGQVVGDGIVVDVSRYFTKIINVNLKAKTVTVQPGVVRDELNNYLKQYGLFFGPNTSTSNRCMIGGMVGNNSSGTTSIQYGVTRDKVIELKTILSNGDDAVFKSLSKEEFKTKLQLNTFEGKIYKEIYDNLNSEEVQKQIKNQFPKATIHRRNTGYAIDELINSELFSDSKELFNMCKLLSGSEGTLAFTTEITLKLDEIPPEKEALVALHFNTLSYGLSAVKQLMKHNLYTCELLDDTILNLTKHNKEQQQNRVFIKDSPKALILCELRAETDLELDENITHFLKEISTINGCYAYPILKDDAIVKAMNLRKAGLGLLGNIKGDAKAVACIEDTAVDLNDFENYISDFTDLMKKYNQKAVYYAHAGAGELHLRPILNLKLSKDVTHFKAITLDVAKLVKTYNGSLSGEHGDGIVRSEFIELMLGSKNYELLKSIKHSFDPNAIFNPGKIIKPLAMDDNLRYQPDRQEPTVDTFLDFNDNDGILRTAEKCNGSGDCRKQVQFGGVMCPSYRATLNEKDTTRARANTLREVLSNSNTTNKFDSEALKEVFDLCLSCKACASECPSSVDVAILKAEFQYQYNKVNGVNLNERLQANFTKSYRLASKFVKISNSILSSPITSKVIKKISRIHSKRSLPKVTKPVVLNEKELNHKIKETHQPVFLFIDEFINFSESQIAKDAIYVLSKLNYNIIPITHLESGRSQISKGFLEEAKQIANKNISFFKDLNINDFTIIGIEPSAILSFKDEYLRLADDKSYALELANKVVLLEDFIQKEFQKGNITSNSFTSETKRIKFHGHCHQKALLNQKASFDVLNIPENYNVTIIPSGCCGMAGSFGYDKDKYDLSLKIAEQTLFPVIRKANSDTIISANGTSCRHQIKDGLKLVAKHPITILREALLS